MWREEKIAFLFLPLRRENQWNDGQNNFWMTFPHLSIVSIIAWKAFLFRLSLSDHWVPLSFAGWRQTMFIHQRADRNIIWVPRTPCVVDDHRSDLQILVFERIDEEKSTRDSIKIRIGKLFTYLLPWKSHSRKGFIYTLFGLRLYQQTEKFIVPVWNPVPFQAHICLFPPMTLIRRRTLVMPARITVRERAYSFSFIASKRKRGAWR